MIKNSVTKDLLQNYRLFTILDERLQMNPHFDRALHLRLLDYCDAYCDYHEISAKELKENYFSYIRSYNKDARLFVESGKYPAFTGEPVNVLGRRQYSIILLLSTFLTSHRFRIMKQLVQQSKPSDAALFVGCGPGLEIFLLDGIAKNIVAYDLELDAFLEDYHKKVEFRKDYFDGSGGQKYDSVYLIEILEHLEDPYNLLSNCKKVMSADGKLHLTTATNIPQFDHLYYFDHDHSDFDQRIEDMGYKIVFQEDIQHEAITVPIDSKNKYYILKHRD